MAEATQLGAFGAILEERPILLFRGVGTRHSAFIRSLPYRFIDPFTETEIPYAQYYNQILFPHEVLGNGCVNAEYLALPEWKLKEVMSTQTARASGRGDCIPQMGMMHRIFCSCRVSRIRECQSSSCVAFKDTLRDLIPVCKSWDGIELWALQVAACICSKRIKVGASVSSPHPISALPSVIISMCKDHHGLHPTEVQEYTVQYRGRQAIEKVQLKSSFLSYAQSIDLSEVLVILSWLQGIVTGYYETVQEPIGLLSPFHERGRIFNDSIASAVEKGRQLQLCPHHIWAIAASLAGREFNLPALIPGKEISVPGHKEHTACTFDFCEESVKNATTVVQMHECRDASTCSKVRFRQDLLHQHASQGNPTAWKLDGTSLLEEGQPFMAISHIWADGTGVGQGTPGEINACLYRFFCQMAEKFMCQGMWWDTICIPTDPKWRGKIMNNVHINYAKAEVTLVHDLYLRSHEWADAESASFAILMSSWFTRGWTTLELARSKRVKVLFKSGVIKDLDQDILAKPGVPCSSHRQLATTVIRNLRKEITDLNGLLTSLSSRYTSWQRDKAIIAALLAKVDDDEITKRTVQGIYQRILVKMGTVFDGHLFHSSATMSRGFSWCPTSLLEMPLAYGSPSPLKISKTGDVVGYWKVAEVRDDLPVQYVWKDIHPLTIIMLQLALRHGSNHLLLVESRAEIVTRALLVKVMKWPHGHTPTEVRCKFIGPVYFQDMGGNETVGGIEIVIGDTEGMVELEDETALEYAHRVWEERRKHDDYATGSIELPLDRLHM